jgi:hypothetical protein
VDYSRALELNPTDVSAFLGRAQVFMERRHFNQAIEDLDAAIGSIDCVPGASLCQVGVEVSNSAVLRLNCVGSFTASIAATNQV